MTAEQTENVSRKDAKTTKKRLDERNIMNSLEIVFTSRIVCCHAGLDPASRSLKSLDSGSKHCRNDDNEKIIMRSSISFFVCSVALCDIYAFSLRTLRLCVRKIL